MNEDEIRQLLIECFFHLTEHNADPHHMTPAPVLERLKECIEEPVTG